MFTPDSQSCPGYRQKSLNGAALNCVYLVVCWIDQWQSQS
jgi:hypothetical protein